jgi:hypothetical protein
MNIPSNGKILRDFDTAREFATVKNATANGSSMDAGGPAIAGA